MTSDLFAQTRIGEHSAIGVDNSAPLWATISLLPVLHRLILGLLSFFNSFFFQYPAWRILRRGSSIPAFICIIAGNIILGGAFCA